MFTNLYVACCGAALTAATHLLFGQPLGDGIAAGLVFCCTLSIYNLDRLVEPSPGDSEHEKWVERHRKQLWSLALLGAVGALYFGSLLRSASLLSLIPAGLVALGYCLPVIRYGGQWRRLKSLPGAKLLLIAGVWTYATAGLPMLEAGISINTTSVSILTGRLLFLAAIALPFDVPDMQRDQQAGIITLPTLLGIRKTKAVGITLTVLVGLTTIFHPWPPGLAVVLSCIVGLSLILALKPDRGIVYFMVLLDGTLLIQAAALVLCAR